MSTTKLSQEATKIMLDYGASLAAMVDKGYMTSDAARREYKKKLNMLRTVERFKNYKPEHLELLSYRSNKAA